MDTRRRRRHTGALVGAAALLAAALVACTGQAGTGTAGSGSAGAGTTGTTGAGALTDRAPCPGSTGFTCGTLTVPLDRTGERPGQLRLKVAVAGNAHAPRGDLLFLAGGPGQPGVPLVSRIAQRLAPVLGQYRLVMVDQRGTGAGALRCPALQDQMGSSDLAVPTAQAVTDCADALGPDRRFYGTADTVADIDQLREALGADRLTVDGVSYGTFVAERYALAHPDRVARLVLDSVVPQQGYDPLDLAALPAAARVLTDGCHADGCTTDPAADLAAVVARYHDGPAVLDLLTSYEFVDPDYRGIPEALHQAAQGHPEQLQQDIATTHQGDAATADQLSQGLHAAALCADGRFPWGGADTAVPDRAAALDRARQQLTAAQTWPFDAATATGLGSLLSCLPWPQEAVPAAPPAQQALPRVPVLLLGGDRDLSTPLEWLHQEAASAPLGQVVVVPGAAHSVQSHATSDVGRQAVYDFLLAPDRSGPVTG
ncbi:alpha/beta fold hydrolase [Kitasatospora sp. NPDC058965]|uniref:alpha/beta fold hydrolase n=1 Tax=Kitasatospora sp. NPDC058965 TaxID=3346682 RepID=UPI0036A5269F